MEGAKRVSARAFALSKSPPLNVRRIQKLAELGKVDGMEQIAGAYTAYPEAWQVAWDNRNTKRGRPKGATNPGHTPQ